MFLARLILHTHEQKRSKLNRIEKEVSETTQSECHDQKCSRNEHFAFWTLKMDIQKHTHIPRTHTWMEITANSLIEKYKTRWNQSRIVACVRESVDQRRTHFSPIHWITNWNRFPVKMCDVCVSSRFQKRDSIEKVIFEMHKKRQREWVSERKI